MPASPPSRALPRSSTTSHSRPLLCTRYVTKRLALLALLVHLLAAATAQEGVSRSAGFGGADSVGVAATDVDTTSAEEVAAPDSLPHPVFSFVEHVIEQKALFEEALADSIGLGSTQLKGIAQKQRAKRRLLRFLGRQIDRITQTDSLYIEPQHYNWAFMVQNTTTFERFTMSGRGKGAQELSFAPDPTFRIGGYFGWRWLFLGYTFDINSLAKKDNGNNPNTEIDLSIYSSKIGIDLFYRKTGNDFRIRNLDDFFSEENPKPETLNDQFSGLNIKTVGLNVYYIFNHRHFSYPAAFSQSTVQRRSCGSFKLGFSYSHHNVSFDQTQLADELLAVLDESMFFQELRYDDYQINFGYSYNWVFARNWLFCGSLSPGMAYNVTSYSRLDEQSETRDGDFLNFRFDKLNVDFIVRLGLVWNNTKYFAGCSFIVHTFDYSSSSFELSNSFGSLNFYVGFNFDRRVKRDREARKQAR